LKVEEAGSMGRRKMLAGKEQSISVDLTETVGATKAVSERDVSGTANCG
jgi:hypothetical protein